MHLCPRLCWWAAAACLCQLSTRTVITFRKYFALVIFGYVDVLDLGCWNNVFLQTTSIDGIQPMKSCLLLLDVCTTISFLVQISCKHTDFYHKPSSSIVFKASVLIHVSSKQGVEEERLMWHKIYLLPYIKKKPNSQTSQQHVFEWVECLCIGLWLCILWQWLLSSTKAWFNAWGTTA